MDKDDFKEWKEDPVTEKFLQYLLDSAKEEAEFVTNAVLSGEIIPVEDQIRMATMSLMFNQIAVIDFEEMESFYKK